MPKNTTSRLYVGKVFSLKKSSSIGWELSRSWDSKKGSSSWQDFGERVLIVDENIKRVRVLGLNGRTVWIAKYYLQTEINEDLEDSPVGELGKVINELTTITGKLEDEVINKRLYNVLKQIRLVKEKLEKES